MKGGKWKFNPKFLIINNHLITSKLESQLFFFYFAASLDVAQVAFIYFSVFLCIRQGLRFWYSSTAKCVKKIFEHEKYLQYLAKMLFLGWKCLYFHILQPRNVYLQPFLRKFSISDHFWPKKAVLRWQKISPTSFNCI